MRRQMIAVTLASAALLVGATSAGAQAVSRVSIGSPIGSTPENHQNEPAVALDAKSPNVLVAGANDFVDQEACPRALAVDSGTCLDRAVGVGFSGVYFSFDSGRSWTQPSYTGLTNADCDPTTLCKGHAGTIHTVPWYAENQLVSFGDPALAVGPVPGPDGAFSWANGERVYYATLTAALSTQVEFSFPNPVFNGLVGVAVSRLDNPTATSVLQKSAWRPPVIVSSHQGQMAFQDKEQMWADNAASSRFFGRVYICSTDYRSQKTINPAPVESFYSADGGGTWTRVQVTSAATNGHGPNAFGYTGCAIRTDSHGVVYLFDERYDTTALSGAHVMFKSYDGGAHWTQPQVIEQVTNPCYFVDPLDGRCVMDGYAGARTDLSGAPSIAIANGAPTGAGATNEIIDAWSDAPALDGEVADVTFSTDGGSSWSPRQSVALPGDRPLYSAGAIAPDGSRAYVIYEADTTPWVGADFTAPRPYHGVLLSAPLDGAGSPTAWTVESNEPPGDLRATFPGHDLYQERVGDYVYAAAANGYGVGLWASARDATVCEALQNWRAKSLAAGQPALPGAPWPLTDCPASFGNVDIFSVSTG